MLTHYLKTAFRQILKNKIQYILSILGIAIGLWCFSMFNYFMQKDIYGYKEWQNHERMGYCIIEEKNDKDSIRELRATDKELQLLLGNPVAGIEKIAFKKSLNAVINFSEFDFSTHNIAVVNNNFFDIYFFQTVEGTACKLYPNEIFISQSFAKNLFRHENPIGQSISMSSFDSSVLKTYIVSGVLDDQFKSLDDIYCLYEDDIGKISRLSKITLLLSLDVSKKEINSRLKKQFPPINDNGIEKTISVKMIKEDYGLDNWLFAIIIAPLILISAMINFLKFSIQSFLNRTRELSLRKSLGSNNVRLFFLLITEIIIVLSISMLVTFIMSKIFLGNIYIYLSPFLHPDQVKMLKVNELILFTQQVKSIFYLFIISTFICFFVLLRVKLTNIIIGIKSAGRGKHSVQNFFLGFQLMICLFFVGISVIVIDFYRSQIDVNITLSKKECARILIPRIKQGQIATFEELRVIISEIKKLSYLEDVLYFTENNGRIILSNDQTINLKYFCVSNNYAQFMNLPINGKMPQNETECLISQALIQALENASEDVSNIKMRNSFFQVTGIFETLPFCRAKEEIMLRQGKEELFYAITYLPFEEEVSMNSNFYVKAVAGYEKKLKESIIKIIQNYIPGYDPIQIINFGELSHLPKDYTRIEILKDFVFLFSIISLLIASLGIYSAITLDTRGRQKEVAIRKINGAGKKEIALLFGKLYIKVLIISTIITLPVCYYLFYQLTTINRYTREIPFSFKPIHWIINALIVSGIVFITVLWQIQKVTRTNPVEVIKSE